MDRTTDRSAYMGLVEEALALRDMADDLIPRVRVITDRYGDPLNVRGMLEEALPFTAEIPDAPRVPTPASPRRAKGGFTRRSYTTAPIVEITFDLVRQNPGRTLHQLQAAMSQLPPERQFHAHSMSPALSDLARAGRIVRALCDTERALKFYPMGAVPPGQRVFDATVNVAQMSNEEREQAARPPTVAETGQQVSRLPDGEIHRAPQGMRGPHRVSVTGGYIEGAQPEKQEAS